MNDTARLPSDECSRAVVALAEAAEFARDSELPPWEFALDVQALGQVGAGPSALRWLFAKGHVECRRETTSRSATKRTFRVHKNLSLSPGVCFVLSPTGARLAELIGRETTDDPPPKPRWDIHRRELWLGGTLAKAFTVPAANQDVVLAAFEEQGWPSRIDDPLPSDDKVDAKERLRDTVSTLNRTQSPQLIKFSAVSGSRAVVWSPC